MNRIRISFSHNILFKKATSKIVHSCFHRWQRLLSDTRRFWQRSSKNCFNLCVASRLSYGRVKTVLYHILLQSPPWTAYNPLSIRFAFKCFFLQKVMAFHKGNLIHFQNQKSVLQQVFRNIKKIFFFNFEHLISSQHNIFKISMVSHLKNGYLWFYFLTQNKIP